MAPWYPLQLSFCIVILLPTVTLHKLCLLLKLSYCPTAPMTHVSQAGVELPTPPLTRMVLSFGASLVLGFQVHAIMPSLCVCGSGDGIQGFMYTKQAFHQMSYSYSPKLPLFCSHPASRWVTASLWVHSSAGKTQLERWAETRLEIVWVKYGVPWVHCYQNKVSARTFWKQRCWTEF